MKLQTLSFVSIAMVLVSGVVGCAGSEEPTDGEASVATGAELHSAGGVSLGDLAKAMRDEAQGMENADGCSFSTKSTPSGLVIELKNDKDGTITLNVSSHDGITHKVKPDGDSSVETYQIAGVGSVELVHADDAFEEVNVTSAKTKKTVSCEVDF